jgi:hypothetical protein
MKIIIKLINYIITFFTYINTRLILRNKDYENKNYDYIFVPSFMDYVDVLYIGSSSMTDRDNNGEFGCIIQSSEVCTNNGSLRLKGNPKYHQFSLEFKFKHLISNCGKIITKCNDVTKVRLPYEPNRLDLIYQEVELLSKLNDKLSERIKESGNVIQLYSKVYSFNMITSNERITFKISELIKQIELLIGSKNKEFSKIASDLTSLSYDINKNIELYKYFVTPVTCIIDQHFDFDLIKMNDYGN